MVTDKKWTVSRRQRPRTDASRSAPHVEVGVVKALIKQGELIKRKQLKKEEKDGELVAVWRLVEAVDDPARRGYVLDKNVIEMTPDVVALTTLEIFPTEVTKKDFAETCVRQAIISRTNAAYLYALAWVESGGEWSAAKVTSPADGGDGAIGTFQFTKAFWKQIIKEPEAVGLTAKHITSPTAQCIAAAIYAQKGSAQIQGVLGREVSALDLYLAHLFGPKGAIALLNAEKEKSGEKVADVLNAELPDASAETKAAIARKPAIFGSAGDATIKAAIKKCVKLLEDGFKEVEKIADALGDKIPVGGSSPLGDVGSTQAHAGRILEIAKRYLGRPYKNIRIDYTDEDWKGAFDCAEYATYCAYRAFGRLYGTTNNADISKADAYTGAWKNDSKNLGIRLPWKDALKIPGAFLLRYPPAPGKMGHIAISLGDGKNVYEARGKAHGVGKFSATGRKWDTGVKLPWVNNGAPESVELDALTFQLTNPMAGYDPRVERIQKALVKAGALASSGIDGVFGEFTKAAVEKFQKAVSVLTTGIVDAETGKLLLGDKLWNELQSLQDSVQVPQTGSHDLLTLARTIWGEARGESKTGREAVCHVMLNRAKSSRYPSNVARVCLQPFQFSCWNKNDPNFRKIRNLQPGSFKTFDECLQVARDVLSGKVEDHTLGALHYYATSISAPAWVRNSPKAKMTAHIGHHKFYVGIK